MPPRLETAPSAPVLQQAAEDAVGEALQETEATPPEPSGPTSHEQAMQMCRRIDKCFASLLPVRELASATIPEDTQDHVSTQVKHLSDSAKWLDVYFNSLREQAEQCSYDKEIADLENELKSKDDLMRSCSESLREWRTALEKLQKQHAERLAAV